MEVKIEYGDSVKIVMRRTSGYGGMLRAALLDKLDFIQQNDERFITLSYQDRVTNGMKLWFAKSMSQIVSAEGLGFPPPTHANGSTESLFDQYLQLDEVLLTKMWETAQALDAPIGEKKTGDHSGNADPVRGTGKRRKQTTKTG